MLTTLRFLLCSVCYLSFMCDTPRHFSNDAVLLDSLDSLVSNYHYHPLPVNSPAGGQGLLF